MMPRRKSSDRVQIGLRIREELRADLEKSAKAQKVSLNTEIVNRLEETPRREKRVQDIRKAFMTELYDRVGGERQFRQLMSLGWGLNFFAIDIAARIPEDESDKIRTAVIQIPTFEKTSSKTLVGNHSTWTLMLAKKDAKAFHKQIHDAVLNFNREESK